MAQQIINLGATGSGAGGDSARTAFEKAIANFAELYPAALPSTAAQKQAARDMFGLGTAATKAAQANATDTTAGALMAVGSHGLGGRSVVAPNDNLNLIAASGFYAVNSATLNIPLAASGSMCLHMEYNTGFAQQILTSRLSDRVWFRRSSSGVWSAWVELFHAGNILGTVSQSGGVPTGAIIEMGANSNGRYTKFAGGLLVCEHSISMNASSDVDWTFPAAFSATPLVFGQAGSGDRVLTHGATAPNAISAGSLRGWVISNSTRTSSGFSVAAIGRW